MTWVVFGPVVKVVDSFCQPPPEPGVQVDTSCVPVPVAPRYTYEPCTCSLSVYVEFGLTVTV